MLLLLLPRLALNSVWHWHASLFMSSCISTSPLLLVFMYHLTLKWLQMLSIGHAQLCVSQMYFSSSAVRFSLAAGVRRRSPRWAQRRQVCVSHYVFRAHKKKRSIKVKIRISQNGFYIHCSNLSCSLHAVVRFIFLMSTISWLIYLESSVNQWIWLQLSKFSLSFIIGAFGFTAQEKKMWAAEVLYRCESALVCTFFSLLNLKNICHIKETPQKFLFSFVETYANQ